jgi:hypothetical protein
MVFLLGVSGQAQEHASCQIGHVDGFLRIGASADARLRGACSGVRSGAPKEPPTAAVSQSR